MLGGIAYFAFLSAALVVGSAAGWLSQSNLARTLVSQKLWHVPPKEAFGGKDHEVVLLLGCDEDLYFGGNQILKHAARSDMMLLANLDFAHNRITGLSIPRDLRVKMPHMPVHKINAFHAVAPWGHENEWTQKAVEFEFPGVHIDKVLTVDYNAFDALVDEVGGVGIDIDKKMDYDDYAGHVHVHFVPGFKTLNGHDAEMFVRFRHADSDFERQKRQKEFLIAFKDAVLNHKTALPQVFEEGKKVFGSALDDDQIAALVNFASTVNRKDIVMGEIPSHPGPGTWVLLDKGKVEPALKAYGLLSDSDSQSMVSDAR
jgi:LCP family protein required for cell wall assembly